MTEEESLPFDAHIERLPAWGVAMAALTTVIGFAAAAHLLSPPWTILPFLASTIARRVGGSAVRVEIDGDGLWVDEKLLAAKSEILDAWADPDDTDNRVAVTLDGGRVIVFLLPNKEQAARFARALPRPHVVAGVLPRAVDLLMPLRIVAIMTSSISNTHSPVGLFLLVFVAISGWGMFIGRQIDVGPDGVTLRSLFGATKLAFSEVDEESLSARRVRSAFFGTSAWTRHAHARAMKKIAEMKRGAAPKKDAAPREDESS